MPSDLGAEIFGADYSEKESVITDKEANFVSESHCEPRNSVLYLASISSVGKKKAPKFKREVSGVFGVCFSCSAGSHVVLLAGAGERYRDSNASRVPNSSSSKVFC
jgi:hypothetical protein